MSRSGESVTRRRRTVVRVSGRGHRRGRRRRRCRSRRSRNIWLLLLLTARCRIILAVAVAAAVIVDQNGVVLVLLVDVFFSELGTRMRVVVRGVFKKLRLLFDLELHVSEFVLCFRVKRVRRVVVVVVLVVVVLVVVVVPFHGLLFVS